MKPSRLCISFSGGRTSAYMTQRLLREVDPTTEVVVIYANTGEEDERTLQFVDRCDREFGFNVVWVEAEVNPKSGAGTRHKVVDFRSATRRNAVLGPFEQVIAKYGIPNKNFPHCTRELKRAPITSYLRSIGWKAGTYTTAIGIRADEKDRISPSASKNHIDYPLVRWDVTKSIVLDYFRGLPFDLYLPEHRGNCLSCWKKSDRKLLTLMNETPSCFNFMERMERLYPNAGPGDQDRPRRFFRLNRTVLDLTVMSLEPFNAFRDDNEVFDPELDVGGGCGETCEVFADADGVYDEEERDEIVGLDWEAVWLTAA
ncbi:MAG TPA: phosphoadenosine phosphosulfate reductase family protein [Candidatus Binatia bacterium]|nr:phosphoadenosine phosphosulfate reductase family protein [Candidatus Binatia bacterium]